MVQNAHLSPYKGLQPYTEKDADYFFGRKMEEKLIINNLLVSRLTLLYGESGVGKSSLLAAGVAHNLWEQARLKLTNSQMPDYIAVVFNNWRSDPVEGILKKVKETILKLYARYNLTLPPITGNLTETLFAWTEMEPIRGKLLIILDQFEEYFLHHTQMGDNFARQFSQAVNNPNLNVNFLISIREDQLHKLDRLKRQLPTLHQNHFRILPLNRDAARRVISEPVYYFRVGIGETPYSIEPALVESVLDELETIPGDSNKSQIEPFYLQLVMTRLWNEMKKDAAREINLGTLEKLKGVKAIVRSHLDTVLANLSSSELEIIANISQYLALPNSKNISHSPKALAQLADINEKAILGNLLEKLSNSDTRILKRVQSRGVQNESHYQLFNKVMKRAVLEWRTTRVSSQKQYATERGKRLRFRQTLPARTAS